MSSKKAYSYPTAVVFDLDYTLWPCWCDTHISPPIKPISKTAIVDSYGTKLKFFKDVESIIQELAEQEVTIIAASRTCTPRLAQEMLSHLHINDVPSIKWFHSLQWGTGSKINHISRAAKELGLQKELQAGGFILFDDEYRNRDVKKINCHFGYIEDDTKGLTREIFERNLMEWTSGHPASTK